MSLTGRFLSVPPGPEEPLTQPLLAFAKPSTEEQPAHLLASDVWLMHVETINV